MHLSKVWETLYGWICSDTHDFLKNIIQVLGFPSNPTLQLVELPICLSDKPQGKQKFQKHYIHFLYQTLYCSGQRIFSNQLLVFFYLRIQTCSNGNHSVIIVDFPISHHHANGLPCRATSTHWKGLRGAHFLYSMYGSMERFML